LGVTGKRPISRRRQAIVAAALREGRRLVVITTMNFLQQEVQKI